MHTRTNEALPRRALLLASAFAVLCSFTGCAVEAEDDATIDADEEEQDDETLETDEESDGEGLELLEEDDLTSEPMGLTQKPKMWAPFPSGTSYMCTQGPNQAPTHNAATTQYALDFDTPNGGAAEPVVAALAGTVAYVKSTCVVGDLACGSGFGNHVRIDHGGGYYSLYAHLSSVSVAVGTKVGRAQTIGYEGNTGNSTGDHLHFSLHSGNAANAAVASSVTYSVKDKDTTINDAFTDRNATGHTCGLPGGHFYQSNNVCSSVFNTTGTAKVITNNTPYLGETCSVGDTDYFSFSGGPGSFTSSVTSTSESISDCSCSILNAQGIELQQGGAEGYVRNDGFNGTQGCACSLTNAPAATYYLKVYSQMPGAYVLNKTVP